MGYLDHWSPLVVFYETYIMLEHIVFATTRYLLDVKRQVSLKNGTDYLPLIS